MARRRCYDLVMSPRPLLFRLSLAGLACMPWLAGCKPAQPAPAPRPAPPIVQTAEAPRPMTPSALDRAGLLQALDLAASSYASGRPTTGDDFAGRRFVLREAFGCEGPAPAATPGLAQWAWGRDRRSIEITLTPLDWSRDAIFSGAGSRWEAVEGFWIARPWMRDPGCAAPPAVATPAPPSQTADGLMAVGAAPPSTEYGTTPQPAAATPQVAGLASVFEEGGSRVGRRDGKPFTFTLRPENDGALAAPAHGFRLVIEGRLTVFPTGLAVRCQATSVDVRPVCFVAGEVDRVAFEDADGKLLREWRPG